MKWLHRLLDLVTATGLALVGLSGGGAVPQKWGLIGGAAAGVAGKLAQSPAWVPPKEPGAK